MSGQDRNALGALVACLWHLEGRILEGLRDPFLLLIRVVWGLQFVRTGWGKLHNIEGVTAFFTDLGIPAPGFHAGLVGTVELVGGLCLALGLATRVTLVPLTISMLVAYATADRDAVLESGFLSTGAFSKAEPFPFLYTCLVVLLFGPGRFSADGLLAARAGGPAAAVPEDAPQDEVVRNVQALRTSDRGAR